MTPLRHKVIEAYDARTPLHKAAAILRALDALEAAIGQPGDEMNKAAGGTTSLQASFSRIEASIANIEAQDRLRAAAPKAKPIMLKAVRTPEKGNLRP